MQDANNPTPQPEEGAPIIPTRIGPPKPVSKQEENIREGLRKIGETVDEQIPKGWGFVVLVFPMDRRDGSLNYTSNVTRQGGLITVRKWLEARELEQLGRTPP